MSSINSFAKIYNVIFGNALVVGIAEAMKHPINKMETLRPISPDNTRLAVVVIVFTGFALALGDALIKGVSTNFTLWQIAEKTLRNWRYNGKYPQIFIKLGGKVFVDLGELAKIITEQQEQAKLSLKSNNS